MGRSICGTGNCFHRAGWSGGNWFAAAAVNCPRQRRRVSTAKLNGSVVTYETGQETCSLVVCPTVTATVS